MRMLVATTFFLVAGPLLAEDKYLRYLPSDTKVVFTLHIRRLSENDREQGQAMLRDAYKKHICPTLAKADALPMSDLEQIVLALPYAGTFNGLILIRGRIDLEKFEQQMNRAAKGSRTVTSGRKGTPAITVYRCKLDEKVMLELAPGLGKIPPLVRRLVVPQEIHIAALDDQTLIASLCGLPAVTRALRSRPAKTAPRIPAELAKLLREEHKADTSTLILMEDSLHPGLQLISDAATKETFDQFEYVRFHLRGGKAVEIETVVKSKSSDLGPTLEKKARRVLEVIREQLPTAMPDPTRRDVIDSLVKSFRVTRKDEQVTIAGSMTEADAKKFIAGGKK
jgi:hypothetical protein